MAASSSVLDTETSAVSFTTDVELKAATAVQNGAAMRKSSAVYLVEREGRWSRMRNSCLFKRSCAAYSLILALIWLLNTIPIIVYLSVNPTVRIPKLYCSISVISCAFLSVY